MTLQEVIDDVYELREKLAAYERKYGVLSETFYESYQSGEEPPDDNWVLDWSAWAGLYKIWLRRQDAYREAIRILRLQTPLIVSVIQTI